MDFYYRGIDSEQVSTPNLEHLNFTHLNSLNNKIVIIELKKGKEKTQKDIQIISNTQQLKITINSSSVRIRKYRCCFCWQILEYMQSFF